MEKLKVSGISSEEYPGGRIDIFKIFLSEELVYSMENLFRDFGFAEEIINDLDIHYPSSKGYFFFYSSRIKAHMFFEENILNLIFDSKISKKEIFKIFGKHFQFPE